MPHRSAAQMYRAARKSDALLTGAPLPTLFYFALPIILGNIFQQLYSIVDAIVVGKFLGDLPLAGISVAAPIVDVANALVIGGTIGIVGGIIIGQAAVEAGIVSNLMVIVVSVTAIAGFVIPSQDMAQTLRVTRFFMMFFAGMFGLCGLVISVNLLLIYLLQMRSLSRPYLMPILPFRKKSLGNTIIRAPFSFLRRRARIARPIDEYRGIGK